MKGRYLSAALYAALFAGWWIVAALHIWPAKAVPSPAAVGGFLWDAMISGTLLSAVAASAGRVLLGYGISLVGGTAFGLALARVRVLDDMLGTTVVGLQSLPSICWFPLALLWFGGSEKAVLFVIIMGSWFAITLAVRAGVRGLPPLLLRAAQSLGARGAGLWLHVLLPAILPAFLGGMRLGWAFSWRSLMAGELISKSLHVGVGGLLGRGRDTGDMAAVLGMIAVILVFGLVVDRLLFVPLERLVVRRWGVEGA